MGCIHEKDVIDYVKSIDVNECRLMIVEELPFLVVTPGGLIGNDGTVEIKCPSPASDLTHKEAIIQQKVKFWSINKQTNDINLNKSICISTRYKVGQLYTLKKIIAYLSSGCLKVQK